LALENIIQIILNQRKNTIFHLLQKFLEYILIIINKIKNFEINIIVILNKSEIIIISIKAEEIDYLNLLKYKKLKNHFFSNKLDLNKKFVFLLA